MFRKVDTPLLIAVLTLLIGGLVIFGSAALGVLAVNEVKFYSVIKTQFIYALIGGSLMMFLGMSIPIAFYKKYAAYLFGAAFFATCLVFVPGLSTYHGGAHRWVDIGAFSVQPSEGLKFTFVAIVALLCTQYRSRFKEWKYGFWPYTILAMLVSALMLAQPDFGTYLVIMTASFVVFFVGGARKKHCITLVVAAIIAFCVLVASRPYMMERVKTFLNGSHDPRGSSWQLNQSLIAIGTGGLTGRGLGQSVQKFNYLPEPIGDSVFAVAAEELGFIGAMLLIGLYAFIGLRGYTVSIRAQDQFSRLLGVGIVTILLTQGTLNIGSMMGILPLTGLPLPLVSHGGTALMIAMFECGVLLLISQQHKLHQR